MDMVSSVIPTWLRGVVSDRKAEHKRDCEAAIKPDSDRTKPGRHSRMLPYRGGHDTAFHTKITLNIDDTVMAEQRREAARQGRTMSEMVETAVRLLLGSKRKRGPLPRCRPLTEAASLSTLQIGTRFTSLWKGDSGSRRYQHLSVCG
jgi:hypothetical protein